MFRSFQIRKILGIKKIRFEYLRDMLNIKPHYWEKHGKRKYYYYTKEDILKLGLGHILSHWGFKWNKILEVFNIIIYEIPDFFSAKYYKPYPSSKNFSPPVMLISNPNGENLIIKRYNNDKNNKIWKYLNRKGTIFINISLFQIYIIHRVEEYCMRE